MRLVLCDDNAYIRSLSRYLCHRHNFALQTRTSTVGTPCVYKPALLLRVVRTVVSNQVCSFLPFFLSRSLLFGSRHSRIRHCGSTVRTDVSLLVLLCTPSGLVSLPSQSRTTSPPSRLKLRSTMFKMLTAIHNTDSEMKIYFRFCTGWITRASYITLRVFIR